MAIFHPEPEDVPRVQTPAERIVILRKLGDKAKDLPPPKQERASTELADALADEQDALARAQMIRTAANFPTETATRLLKTGMHDNDREVRVACCEAWATRGGPEAAQLLSEALSSDTEIDVRLAAARALGELGDAASIGALGLALEDTNPAMQHRAVLSLKKVTGKDFGNDVNTWREFVQGREPKQNSLVSRLSQWF